MAHGLLVAAVCAERRARLAKGCHEGKADVSAEQSTPEKGPRVSGAYELEEWTPGAEEATGEGAQASYC
jgi:hypothetical protein